MYMFKVKRNKKMPKDVEVSAVQNGYSGFWHLSIFTPKFIFFSKINTYKIQNLKVSKNGIYVVNLLTNSAHKKFEGNIFTFGYAMVKQPGKGDDVTFLNAVFDTSICT